MFGWFQRLLPTSGDFFALFERHAAKMLDASEAPVAAVLAASCRALLPAYPDLPAAAEADWAASCRA